MKDDRKFNKEIVNWAFNKAKEARVRPRFGYYRMTSLPDGSVHYDRPGLIEALIWLIQDSFNQWRMNDGRQKTDPNFSWLTTPGGQENFIKILMKLADQDKPRKPQ